MVEMSRQAWGYILVVLLAAAGLTGYALSQLELNSDRWLIFFVLTGLATLAQLFKAAVPNHQTYYATPIFLFAGVLLLDPALFALIVIISYMVEWAKERVMNSPLLREWYIQPFNIATHLLAGFAAILVYRYFNAAPTASFSHVWVIAVVAAALTYVVLNHYLVGQVLVMARKLSWRESGVLDTENLLTDIVLLSIGAVSAVALSLNPWLLLLVLSPLGLIYRALMIPALKKEAQTDAKTGLWNARHFSNVFTTEMDRAKRFERPLALIMADLDLLRNINNTYGHLAGDTVLAGIGQIIRENIRDYDMAGRFGGEEFAILLPETNQGEARAIAERLRAAVESSGFVVSTSKKPVHVTMSLGISCFPAGASTTMELLHEADVAVYQAKLKGRNCVVCASEIPHSAGMNTASAAARLTSPFTPSFVPRPQEVTGLLPPVPDVPEPPGLTVPDLVMKEATSPALAPQEAEATNPSPAPAPSPAISQEATVRYPTWFLGAFVGIVIVAAMLSTGVGWLFSPRIDLAALILFTALAMGAEWLQINLYGPDTLSVSVAVMFTAALVAGMPGVACVSAAIALVHYFRKRPRPYKTVFNWSTHVLAALPPAATISMLQFNIGIENLVLLAIPISMAALVYFIVDTGLIATAIALSNNTSPVAVWRERFQWLTTHYMVLCTIGLFLGLAYKAQGPLGVSIFALPMIMMRYSQQQYVERTEDSVQELRRMNQELTRANNEVMSASQSMKELNEELFLTLARIIDARDPYVGGHANKVGDYAVAIAKELNLDPERMEPLRQAGFLHDIGKIAISEAILHKPAKLTDEEYEYIKTHAAIGGEFLQMCRALRHLAPFVRHHHERWDGRGYPDMLKGEDIPLESRILAICDAAEAMASDRPYRKGMSLTEMLAEIKRCAGTQFDPEVAKAFVTVVEREREYLIVNSAQEVQRKQADAARILHVTTGMTLSNLNSGPLSGPLKVPQLESA
jgi:diguanylate cyclase (GGDEF)-like protein